MDGCDKKSWCLEIVTSFSNKFRNVGELTVVVNSRIKRECIVVVLSYYEIVILVQDISYRISKITLVEDVLMKLKYGVNESGLGQLI